MAKRTIWESAKILTAFAVAGAAAVALTFSVTKDRVDDNERRTIQRTLDGLVPPTLRDNDIVADTVRVTDPDLLGSKAPLTVYRARRDGQPVAAIFEVIAPDGYSGTIKLLVAIDDDGIIAGVRTVTHKETPGLGDYIEIDRSNWIRSFDGRSLSDPGRTGWHVKKDGGIFDQVTGATITPRAVVKAVYKCLQYFGTHRDQVFAPHTSRSPTGVPAD
jgi:electron transport complex protein RnfG